MCRCFTRIRRSRSATAVNCYAACSPVIEPGRVYVHFGSYGTACLDTATGDVLWKRDDLPCRHYRGPSSSPVIFDNLLILTFDGADLQYLAALDKTTGETVWKTDRNVVWNDENAPGKFAKDGDMRKAHSTPLLVTGPDGKKQLLSGGAKAAFGYDPATGKENLARPLRRLVGRAAAALQGWHRVSGHRAWCIRNSGRCESTARGTSPIRTSSGNSRSTWPRPRRRYSSMA